MGIAVRCGRDAPVAVPMVCSVRTRAIGAWRYLDWTGSSGICGHLPCRRFWRKGSLAVAYRRSLVFTSFVLRWFDPTNCLFCGPAGDRRIVAAYCAKRRLPPRGRKGRRAPERKDSRDNCQMHPPRGRPDPVGDILGHLIGRICAPTIVGQVVNHDSISVVISCAVG